MDDMHAPQQKWQGEFQGSKKWVLMLLEPTVCMQWVERDPSSRPHDSLL